MKFSKLSVAVFLLLSVICSACLHKDIPEPKPVGYFRIELPEHQYYRLDTTLPFSFEQSVHATTEILPQEENTTWMNIVYKDLNASIRFTYFKVPVADSLRKLMISEDKMVKFHYKKAEDVEYSVIRDAEAHIWGQTYEIYGKEVATPLQFWLTDSINRFVRAAIYFDGTPNNDSLQPVIQYLKDDAMHLINTFAWKP